MRYFSNFLEDRRVLTASSSLGGSSNRFNLGIDFNNPNPSKETTTTNTTTTNTTTNKPDYFDVGADRSAISASAQGNTTVWTSAGAWERRFGEKVPLKADGTLDEGAVAEMVFNEYEKLYPTGRYNTSYYPGGATFGGFDLGGYSPEQFHALSFDAQLGIAKEQQAQQRAESAQRIADAHARDMQKAAQQNAAQPQHNDTTSKIIASVGAVAQQVIPLLF